MAPLVCLQCGRSEHFRWVFYPGQKRARGHSEEDTLNLVINCARGRLIEVCPYVPLMPLLGVLKELGVPGDERVHIKPIIWREGDNLQKPVSGIF